LAERASIGQDQSELQDRLTKIVNTLFLHFNRSQIYLEEDIREKLRGFMQNTIDAAALLRSAKSLFDPAFREWLKENKQISATLSEIEKAFLKSLHGSEASKDMKLSGSGV
jgi:DNA anti-recombination protein RmuC